MDPTACLREIDCFLDAEEFDAANCAVEDLQLWIARGGFQPDWSAYPKAAKYYRAHVS